MKINRWVKTLIACAAIVDHFVTIHIQDYAGSIGVILIGYGHCSLTAVMDVIEAK